MYEYAVTIDRVIDGDTVDVIFDLGFKVFKKDRIRLLGINTPEKRTRDEVEKAKGIAATEFAKEWYGAQSAIRVQTSKDGTGKFGRVLGRIIGDDDGCLNDVLVDKGHAVVYDGGKR
jgi:micrococcal nuclease